MSQVTKDKSSSASLPVVDQENEIALADRMLESARPHTNLILLGLAALLLLIIAIAWMIQSRTQIAEGEWISFNQAMAVANATGNTSGIKEVAEEFPDGTAGLWGLQLAGDFEMRRGLDKLGTDRTEGIREIEKARNTLKKVVDAPASSKSTLLQVRSTFSLAYAYESLGDFENAKKLYQQLVDQTGDSAFGKAAKRGLQRATNPAFVTVYERFKNWEDPFAVAPGAPTAEKPDLTFPEIPEAGEDKPKEGTPEDVKSEEGSSDGKPADKPEGDASPIESNPATDSVKPADATPAGQTDGGQEGAKEGVADGGSADDSK